MRAGNYGFIWFRTPSADAVTVCFLDFGAQYLNPTTSNYREYGFQLRCLSE